MSRYRRGSSRIVPLAASIVAAFSPELAQCHGLHVAVNPGGRDRVSIEDGGLSILVAEMAAEVEDRWLSLTDDPHHKMGQSEAEGYLGVAAEWQVTCSYPVLDQ